MDSLKERCERCCGAGWDDIEGIGPHQCPKCHGTGAARDSMAEELAEWAGDGCPEGVSGMPENVKHALARIEALEAELAEKEAAWSEWRWPIGTRLTKTKGSSWTGKVVGYYSTALTPEGYAIESENEPGSVQIYPASALTEQPNG